MIMIEGRTKFAVNAARILVTFGLVVLSCAASAAQTTQQQQQQAPPTISITAHPEHQSSAPNNDSENHAGDTPGNIEEEMRAKRALKTAEKEYQDNVNRARDLSVLGESVNTSFKQKTHLDRDEIKKIEKAEKLAKAIRNAAGGSEDNNEIEQPPKDLACALSKFAEVAESLKKNVEKTPKHVISTAVIDEANVVLELTRIIRTLIPNP